MVVVSFDLHKAREALQKAKRVLKKAEERYDSDCGVGTSLPLISRIKAAERRLAEARANLRRIDPASTD